MKHHVTFENCQDDTRFHRTFEKGLARLERATKMFPKEDALFLHGRIEKHPTKSRCRVTLALNVPGQALVAREQGIDGEIVIREACQELLRQLKKYKAFMRGEPIWKRQERRNAIRRNIKEKALSESPEQSIA